MPLPATAHFACDSLPAPVPAASHLLLHLQEALLQHLVLPLEVLELLLHQQEALGGGLDAQLVLLVLLQLVPQLHDLLLRLVLGLLQPLVLLPNLRHLLLRRRRVVPCLGHVVLQHLD